MTDLAERIKTELLPWVQKPARYTNNEIGSVHKDLAAAKVRLALCFPDLYEIGMSNLGIQILYHMVNIVPEFLCERVFSPAVDMEDLLRQKDLPLFSLESLTPLNQFELIGVSLQHELTYTNFLTLLQLGKVPVAAKDRKDGDPYIFIGGHCAFNPDPLADFIDFAVIGEGEEVILEIMRSFQDNKALPRKEFLKKLTGIEGVYVPLLNNPTKKRYIKDLDKIDLPDKPIVPYIETVHARANVEIMRGCTRGCRFCQAGYVMLPKREFSEQRVLEQAEKLLRNTGYDELSLTSLSTGDYTQLKPLLTKLRQRYAQEKVNISFPSLHLDSFSAEMAEAAQFIRQSGVTLAPEAGSQRLRDLINKNVSEADIINGVRNAVQNGTNSIKLYFMIGLPTETQEDLQALVDLIERLKPLLREHKRGHLTVNISNFVPKAHTPFQWARQDTPAEIENKQGFLKRNIRGKQVQLRWHDKELSALEGIFARGDALLGQVLLKAVENGARFDSWSEHFRPEAWQKAFQASNIDPETYLRERSANEELPWARIDTGVPKAALEREYAKALAQERAFAQ